MNWEAVGAVAEFIGAIGVIASLFYVASQIRRSSGAQEAATNQAISDATQQRLLAMAQTPELAAVYAKAGTDPSDLSPGERVQLDFFTRATFRGIQNAFFQYRRGLISDDAWRDYEAVLQVLVRRAHVQDWWSTERNTYDEAFVAHYEDLASRSPAA